MLKPRKEIVRVAPLPTHSPPTVNVSHFSVFHCIPHQSFGHSVHTSVVNVTLLTKDERWVVYVLG
jgi:hypothetical protein